MSKILGIDTSNYTTSCALLDTDTMEVIQSKKLLPVKAGEKGIRQSDAVFHHTKQLPEMMSAVYDGSGLGGIGVSVKPRLVEGSYMPCFLVGESAADMLGTVCGIEPDKTSHQVGHILAALYSCCMLSLAAKAEEFIAFHISGGTTDMLLCKGGGENVVEITEIGHSLDLKAGQAVDRAGVMLGLSFPCGKELEALAANSDKQFKVRPVIKGMDCSLSGIENKCKAMLSEGSPREDIAKYCITAICEAVRAMTAAALEQYGDLPVIYAGGVMSNRFIADRLSKEFGGHFAAPEFSCDNAVGCAIYSAFRKGLIG
ncbi:MAG: peptidase M22 [Ruminococcus sp.]|nr:peptidase M22 [Ruminococcus sp.]